MEENIPIRLKWGCVGHLVEYREDNSCPYVVKMEASNALLYLSGTSIIGTKFVRVQQSDIEESSILDIEKIDKACVSAERTTRKKDARCIQY